MEIGEKVLKEDENFNYVYFIENHGIDTPIILKFGKNYIEFNDLKPVKEQKFYEPNTHLEFLVSIYRFKIFNLKLNSEKKYEVEIKLIEKGDKETVFFSKLNISNFDKDKDIFLYDFKFEENKSLVENNKPPKFLKLEHPNNLKYIYTIY